MYHRGLMIQAPTGSGKTYYIENNVPYYYKDMVMDGDALLASLKIKNRHYFWYSDNNHSERTHIKNVFENYLDKGYIIFYSGNPYYINTDIIMPDKEERWNRLNYRNEYIPSKTLFNKEQDIYESAASFVPYYINGNIPSFDMIQSIHKELKF